MNGMTNGTYRYYECGNRRYNGHDACEGTTVREDKVMHSIADHLDAEFLSLDGPNDGTNLAWKADREELKPGDLPKAFARVKRLVCPPKQPAADRRRMEKDAKRSPSESTRPVGIWSCWTRTTSPRRRTKSANCKPSGNSWSWSCRSGRRPNRT